MTGLNTYGGRPVLTLKKPSPRLARGEPELSRAEKSRLAKKVLNLSPAWRDHLPLAIGFHRQALERAPDGLRKTMRREIHFRCSSVEYRRAIAAGGPRYRWDGQPDGDISPGEQAGAAKRLEVAP